MIRTEYSNWNNTALASNNNAMSIGNAGLVQAALTGRSLLGIQGSGFYTRTASGPGNVADLTANAYISWTAVTFNSTARSAARNKRFRAHGTGASTTQFRGWFVSSQDGDFHRTTPVNSVGISYSSALTGALTPAGLLATATGRTVSGSITPTGALAQSFVRSLSVVGSLTPSGALVRRIWKLTGGTITPSGALVKRTSFARSGVLSFVGDITKTKNKALSGALSFAGDVLRLGGKTVSGALSFVGGMGITGNVSLSGAMSFLGDIVATGTSTATRFIVNAAKRLGYKRLG